MSIRTGYANIISAVFFFAAISGCISGNVAKEGGSGGVAGDENHPTGTGGAAARGSESSAIRGGAEAASAPRSEQPGEGGASSASSQFGGSSAASEGGSGQGSVASPSGGNSAVDRDTSSQGGSTVTAVASIGGSVATSSSTAGASNAASGGGYPVGGAGSASTAPLAGGASSIGGSAASGGSSSAGGAPVCSTDAAAVPTTCSPSRSFCHGNDIRSCSADGHSSTKVTSCLSTQYCDEGTVSCVQRVCDSPCQLSCDGNVVTTCNANGSGFMGTRVDCGSSNQTCSHGACFTQMLDTVGDDPALSVRAYTNTYGALAEVAVYYQITSTRYLLKAELYATLAKDVDMSCAVYESDVKTGSYYYLISSGSGKSSTATSVAANGWQPCSFSPPVKLTEGRFYAITVGTSANFSYYIAQKPEVDVTTFGEAFATEHTTHAVTLNGPHDSAVADQRLTTVP